MWMKGIIWLFVFSLLSLIISEETFDAFVDYDGWIYSFLFSGDCDFSWVLTCLLLIPAEIELRLTQIRRFHDLGQSGWLSLVFFVASNIPIIGFYFLVAEIIFSLLWAGTSGANKYGEIKEKCFVVKRKNNSNDVKPVEPTEQQSTDNQVEKDIVNEDSTPDLEKSTISEEKINDATAIENKLKKLKEMKEKGIITEEEFIESRNDIIGKI
jgi:uncharacterized membrane protein YhaH (DUF805 family)